ncbi:GntR family transcriptional regulator [Blastococcus sp. URHD0036]|uniref:GntR family transcriptional regulator n=1 Tax=Blastococcus sp. URHD0036 TaxID=1380356 RepID=UPI00049631D8|nr:GntR family transcriptional regulator [Blastococcus sp. URHD0036]
MADELGQASPLQRVRLVDQVTDRLRSMIVSGELLPGHPLLQIQLSERLGVSRTPLREAFRILERDGLVRVSNGNQTVEVTEMTPTEITEIYQIREALDGLAARLLASAGMTAEVEKSLSQSMTKMDKILARKRLDVAAFQPAHIDFHVGIMLANPNRRLQEMAHIVRLSSQMFLPRYLNRTHGGAARADDEKYLRSLFDVAADDHKVIFETIMSGDADKAEKIAKRHIRRSIETIARTTHLDA